MSKASEQRLRAQSKSAIGIMGGDSNPDELHARIWIFDVVMDVRISGRPDGASAHVLVGRMRESLADLLIETEKRAKRAGAVAARFKRGGP